mmetsp:Transcript_12335/g.36652  ORF Transcript_12335/g.36652 Transcript_12335/m.36652 type:complete len:227 (-) Transcript_12335:1069-1749(-)
MNDSRAATIDCLRSLMGALRMFVAWRTFVSTSLLCFASSASFSHISLAAGIVFFASSRAEASAEMHARLMWSMHFRSSSGSPGFFPVNMSVASDVARKSDLSAARAMLVSVTSSKMSCESSSLRAFTSSAAFCRRMKRPSTLSSSMSSASRSATISSNSARVSCHISGFLSSMIFEARLMRGSGAPARRAWIMVALSSAMFGSRGFMTSLSFLTIFLKTSPAVTAS